MPPFDDTTKTAPVPVPVPVSDDTATSSPCAPSEGSVPLAPPTTVTARHSETPVSPRPAVRPDKYPGYELLARIADGGMGTVYQARELALDRIVALKELRLNVFDAATARARFSNEVHTMARIEHPNLVPIYFSGEHDGVPFFTMKHMPGGTLPTERVGRRYTPTEAAETLRAIADGVAALHAAGYIHRDLKPSNILLDDAGVPHVADFGLAKWLDEDEHTQTGLRNGTPPYMSPEQVAGRSRRLTPTCDVWALGVIGYELLAGRRPFDDPDREELFRQIREAPPPSLPAEIPPALVGIIRRCLRKDPLERYPSAAEVRDVLARFLAGEVISDQSGTPADADTTVTVPPAPQGIRRRTVLRAMLGIGAIGTVGGAGYLLNRLLRPDPPPPPLSFGEQVAEDLRNDRTVELIGETGRPKWSDMIPPNGLVEVATPDGTYTIKPNPDGPQLHPCGWLELLNHPIDVPYRVECELCYRELPAELLGYAAVYLGRRTWESKSGPWRTAALLQHRPPVTPQPPLPPRPEDARLAFWTLPVKEGLDIEGGKVIGGPVKLPPDRPPLNRWVKLAFDLRTDLLSATCDGVAVAPMSMNGPALRARLPRDVANQLWIYPKESRPTPPDFATAPTLFGSGLGVFVFRATVSIRAVRLVPLPTPGAA